MKQTVYITTTEKDTWYKIQSPIDGDGLSMSANAIKREGFFFTKEQLKQLLTDYTDIIVENAKKWRDLSDGHYKRVTKESITNQLEPFLKNLL